MSEDDFNDTLFSPPTTPPPKKRKYSQQLLNVSKFNAKTKLYFIGKVKIGSIDCCILDDWQNCKIRINEDQLTLIFDNNLLTSIQATDTSFLTSIFASKIFDFDFKSEASKCYMYLYLRKLPLKKLNEELVYMMQVLMVEFFSVNMEGVYERQNAAESEDLNILYQNLRKYSLSKAKTALDENLNVQHPALRSKLRKYQVDAVRWMLYKERKNIGLKKMNPMFVSITLESKKKIYYNKYTGHLQEEKPLYRHNEAGGILADEIGMGKTVEVLACILNNPRGIEECLDDVGKMNLEAGYDIPSVTTQQRMIKLKSTNKRSAIKELQKRHKSAGQVDEIECICGNFDRVFLISCCNCNKLQHRSCMSYDGEQNSYVCPQCWFSKPLIKSKATLIVCPTYIIQQWSMEIVNHIRKDGLTVLLYNGVHEAGMVYPTDLAQYDLVITSYSVLQSEFKFSSEGSVSLRHAKRYSVQNTPLLNVEWWRICFDEAQNLECSTCLAASMARQLNSVYRWAVTATPMQNSVKDVVELIDHLELTPYNDTSLWTNMLYIPYINGDQEPMFKCLAEIMWRSAMSEIKDEVYLSPLTFQDHWVSFSDVERKYYGSVYNIYSKKFLTNLNCYDDLNKLVNTMDNGALTTLLEPFAIIRKTCLLSMELENINTKKICSKQEVLEKVVKKKVRRTAGCLRGAMAAMNGIAGILILKGFVMEAVDKYKEVLALIRSSEQNNFKIDPFQRIHTLYNLNDVLNNCELLELYDTQFQEPYDTEQRNFMQKYVTFTVQATTGVEAATAALLDIKSKFKNDILEWCLAILDWSQEQAVENEILLKIRSVTCDYSEIKQEITTLRELLNILRTWNRTVDDKVDAVHTIIERIKSILVNNNNLFPTDEVEKAMDCHLRICRENALRTRCLCCTLNSKLQNYKAVICQTASKGEKNGGITKTSISLEERLLKELTYALLPAIYSFAKQKRLPVDLIQQAEQCFMLCEARRKEFVELHELYKFYEQQMSAQDLLNVCKIRYRLQRTKEAKYVAHVRNRNPNIVYDIQNMYEFTDLFTPRTLDAELDGLETQRMVTLAKFKLDSTSLNYIRTLQRQQNTEQTPEQCPVCRKHYRGSWGFFPCGHYYCKKCVTRLQSNCMFIRCCLCRQTHLPKHITYYSEVKRVAEGDVEVIGTFPAKVMEVVKCGLQLRQAEPNVKILIFSIWNGILELLSEAFTANRVDTELYLSSNMHEKIKSFKDDKKKVSILLLPFRLAEQGLNLAEATHLFLIEPLIYSAIEMQAIERVHRIGQTKSTVVHRFLMKYSIEEIIHKTISADASPWAESNLTLLHLKNLFLEHDNLNPSPASPTSSSAASSQPSSPASSPSTPSPHTPVASPSLPSQPPPVSSPTPSPPPPVFSPTPSPPPPVSSPTPSPPPPVSSPTPSSPAPVSSPTPSSPAPMSSPTPSPPPPMS